MTRLTSRELAGFEIVWFLIDRDGCVAQLLTGGTGDVLDPGRLTYEALDAAFGVVEALPETGRAVETIPPGLRLAHPGFRVAEIDQAYARRGLYVYHAVTYFTRDFTSYVRVLAPERPRRVSDFGESAPAALRHGVSRTVSFADTPRLHLADFEVGP
ncbi:hypothetical protein [Deinococcus yunweiensis]|uniref:hypothetical protein n=1 Tax=Deinococcus yunweiensis TaxID=367282 RepID=UPI00398EB699